MRRASAYIAMGYAYKEKKAGIRLRLPFAQPLHARAGFARGCAPRAHWEKNTYKGRFHF